MEREKTAVEWLAEQLTFKNEFGCYISDNTDNVTNIVNQAKQMEKKQMKQDVYNICKLILSSPFEKSGKTPTELFDGYYESKYGKDENKAENND